MTFTRLAIGIATGAAAVVISATANLAGQIPQAPQSEATPTAMPQAGMTADMAATCQALMADRQKMMTEMKSADQRLDDLVSTMNAASGPEKTTAIAAVVSEIVTQRRTMQGGMRKMQDGMMAHMMGHMQAGQGSLAMCPMMKPMGGMKP